MNPDLQLLQPYPMVELQKRKRHLKEQGVDLFDFGTGDPVEPTPPFIRQALIDALPTISQYPSVAGTEQLRSSIADYLQRRFKVRKDPASEIIPSAGSKEAIFHLPLALLDAQSDKNTVIYGSPCYPVYESGTLFANGKTHATVTLKAEDNFLLHLDRIDPEVLKRSAIAWINYPHNPTGAGGQHQLPQAAVGHCREYDIVLVSDECYADLWYDDQAAQPPSLLEAGDEGLLVVHSCSKRSGMTGYRSGFVAGDKKLIATYRRWRASMGVGSPTFIEAAASAAWADDQHSGERRGIFAAKYHLLRQGLMAKGYEVLDSYGGLYLWVRVPAGHSSDSFANLCLEKGIVVSPGGFFGAGGEAGSDLRWYRAWKIVKMHWIAGQMFNGLATLAHSIANEGIPPNLNVARGLLFISKADLRMGR